MSKQDDCITSSFISHSPLETIAFGKKLGESLKPNSIVCFYGDLGAGKTTLIKGIVQGVTGKNYYVNSPTFVYLNIYDGIKSVFHFDLYRIQNEDEFVGMGFEEYFFSSGVCCIEWSERIVNIIPSNAVKIEMQHLDESSRQIVVREELR
ncbi:MAG: tRNA (adenosine(37)-N6)-threonylcarbamoyltransferase complex ATPase subunit type 1 TsaE [Chlamydia sp. 32-24]|nr:MAG: tRNA (adenosine(37)-N6)-threonylcarbamoyltransferase complex ATPase subunit type 1 TsaE [Chlamydia sp. 32-24]